MKDTDVFDGKKLSDLLKDIHDNSVTKRNDIKSVITQLTSFITSKDDVYDVLPMIKELYDVSIKNDEQVIKIATIVQRLISAEAYNDEESGIMLTEAEKDRLYANALSSMNAVVDQVDDVLESAKTKIDGI